MEEKDKQIDWLQNVISVVTLVVLVIFYLYLKREKLDDGGILELVSQVIPDLIAALITVLVLYFVFIRKGMSNQNKLIEKVKEIVAKKVRPQTFYNQAEADKIFNLKDKLESAKEVLISGYSCKYVVAGLRSDFINAVKNGTNVKILIMEPHSAGSNLLSDNQKFKEAETDLLDVYQRTKSILDEIEKMANKRKGTFEMRFLSWIPSCSMIFVIPKKTKIGDLKLKIYAPSGNTPLGKIITHMVIDEYDEKEMYDYFKDEFYKMWNKSKKYDEVEIE